MAALPQFPLGLVLFPTMVLPLHIFEPRYRALVHDVLEQGRRFGVVMIERGTETGGDDQRSGFGTIAEVIEAEEFPDGRWSLVTVGVERFKVSEWLPDDPYPAAEIEPWPDATPDGPESEEFERVEGKFRRCMALTSEAGFDIGPMPETLDCGDLGTMQMAAMLPIGPFDKQQLLGTASSVDRLASIDDAIDTTMELVNLRLQGG
ncbi:MAG: LON peptidase substrate-binding domain-containing protein [Acidimicrobiales bacterium]